MMIDDEGPHRYMVIPEACLHEPEQFLKGLWGYTILGEGGKKVEVLLKSKSFRIHKFGPDDKDPKVRGRELHANAESTRPGLGIGARQVHMPPRLCHGSARRFLGWGGPDHDWHWRAASACPL